MTTPIAGSADEHAEATTEMLEWGVGDVARRYDAKRAAGIVGAIPREVSHRKGSGFHPIYLFVDVAGTFYTALTTSDHTIDTRGAARALHNAVRAIRDELPGTPSL